MFDIKLTTDEKDVVTAVYKYFKTNREWPSVRQIKHEIGIDNVNEVLGKEMHNISPTVLVVREGENLKLTFYGLLACPSAQEDVEILLNYIKLLKRDYIYTDNKKNITSLEIEKELNLSKEQSKRFSLIIRLSGGYLFGSGSFGEEWNVSIPNEQNMDRIIIARNPEEYLEYIVKDKEDSQKVYEKSLNQKIKFYEESPIRKENKEMTKIFISHSSKDEKIVNLFVEKILQLGLLVKLTDIFCTTTDGTKIKSGEDWRNAIKEGLQNAKVTILIITSNYKESEICQNESGGAWIASQKVIPLIIEPVGYKTVGILQEPNQCSKLSDEKSLDQLKDIIHEKLETPVGERKSDVWTKYKKKFLSELKDCLKEHPFEPALDRNNFLTAIEENKDLKNENASLKKEILEKNNYIKNLENLKDKTAVIEVKQKLGYVNKDIEEFKDICEKNKYNFDGLDGFVNGIIFKSFTGKYIDMVWEDNQSSVSKALAQDFIKKDDDDLTANWESTEKMRNIYNSLLDICSFFDRNLSDDFYNYYEKKYKAPLDCNNLDFWKEVFGINVYFN